MELFKITFEIIFKKTNVIIGKSNKSSVFDRGITIQITRSGDSSMHYLAACNIVRVFAHLLTCGENLLIGRKINAFSFVTKTSDRLNLTTQAARDAADPTFIDYEMMTEVKTDEGFSAG